MELVKAFDMKVLAARLKEAGLQQLLEQLEKDAKLALDVSGKWAKESCALSESIVVKFMGNTIDTILPIAHTALDKIDGKSGN